MIKGFNTSLFLYIKMYSGREISYFVYEEGEERRRGIIVNADIKL